MRTIYGKLRHRALESSQTYYSIPIRDTQLGADIHKYRQNPRRRIGRRNVCGFRSRRRPRPTKVAVWISRTSQQKLSISIGTDMRNKYSASTPQAEYVALAHGLKELLWCWHILTATGIKVRLPMTVYEDNQTCVTIANNHMAQRRTRYVDIRYHFIRDYTKDDTITLIYCDTKHMLADILTKALTKPQHERLGNQILIDVLQYIDKHLFTQAAYCKALLASLTLRAHRHDIVRSHGPTAKADRHRQPCDHHGQHQTRSWLVC